MKVYGFGLAACMLKAVQPDASEQLLIVYFGPAVRPRYLDIFFFGDAFEVSGHQCFNLCSSTAVLSLGFSRGLLLIRYTMIQLLTLDTWTDDIARWVIGTYNFDEKTIEDGVFYYCLFLRWVYWNWCLRLLEPRLFAGICFSMPVFEFLL